MKEPALFEVEKTKIVLTITPLSLSKNPMKLDDSASTRPTSIPLSLSL